MLQLTLQPFVSLTTQRLLLRQITEKDAPEMFVLRGNKETMQYIPRPLPQNIEDAVEHIRFMDEIWLKNECINWGITLNGSDRIIGMMGLFRIQAEHHRAEVGYMLSPDYHRQGIISEALEIALDYGFNTLNFHTISAYTDTRNEASWKLLEKHQFTREGHFKHDTFWNNEFSDSYSYSLLNPRHL